MFKWLFGKSLKELRIAIQRQEESEAEIQELKQQLASVTADFEKKLEEEKTKHQKEVVALEKKLERLQGKDEELDRKIQNSNDWIKKTRDMMWEHSTSIKEVKQSASQMAPIVQNLEQKVQNLEPKVASVNALSDKHERKIESIDNWLKDTREKVWGLSSNVTDFKKDYGLHKKYCIESIRKLEHKQKRYCPEDKYELAVSDWYRETTGKDIDIKHPKTFNELIQWAKIHENSEEKSRLSDKYAVREWIKEKIGEEYLIPLLGVYKRAEDIDFESLPQQFVLKCNHGSAYNIIVKDKNQMDKDEVCAKLNNWLKEDFVFKNGIELHYSQIEPCIIAEKYMIEEGMDDLPDYKFFCFGGKVFCSYTMIDYTLSHADGKLGFFDREYKLMPYCRKDFKPITEQLEQPENYSKMVELAERLAEGFSHVRVDFYNINGRIYFGEMTFTTASGKGLFEPDEFDYVLGEQWLKYLPELRME